MHHHLMPQGYRAPARPSTSAFSKARRQSENAIEVRVGFAERLSDGQHQRIIAREDRRRPWSSFRVVSGQGDM
jgi:hypothetical protein